MLKKSNTEKSYQKNEKNPNADLTSQNFWERFSFLSLSFEDKALIAESTLEDIQSNGLYWIQLFLSALIATFGLLQNSVAVIIGGMLIAPLLKPIKGIAFGITTGQNTFLWRASLLLLSSIIVAVGSSFLFALLVPLRIETSEILARIAPNLLDLLIAIASAIIAILAIYYQKLSESTAGVAMAAALLPPLSVVGIELSLNNYGSAWGALFLFLTNLFAILSVGVIIFLIYGFSPHQEDAQIRTTKSVVILFILLGLIAIPLFSSLTQIADKIFLQTQARNVLEESLSETIPQARLESLQLDTFDDLHASFFSTIKIPEQTDFFLETRNAIREQLGNELNREVTLEIEIIPIASIVSQKELEAERLPGKDKQILNILDTFFAQPDLKTTVIDVEVIQSEALMEESSPPAEEETVEELPPASEEWTIKTVFTLPAGETFSESIQQQIEEDVQTQYPDDQFTFLWVPLSEISNQKSQAVETPNDRHLKDVTLQWETFFKRTIPQTAEIQNLKITWELKDDLQEEQSDRTIVFNRENISEYFLKADLYIPDSEVSIVEQIRERMRLFARINIPQPVNISIRVFPFTIQETASEPQ